ncbi:transcriptional regulator, RpiR family [Pseudothermotoga thermarum DSM 5069]|uniref:Transcriptional regulator, RpiR family n=1 Tax=Pseudothermotoga thermarum DSM 5069 TaxID=688269 RepID=F7YU80_9THEM|nr:transcriptional regulator, RpiR family [Pseudothermotoga thermarum DSM 5069]
MMEVALLDVLQTIREKYNTFTKTEKKIADIILQNPRKILESSISDLAKMAGAKSEASVVKFYRKINLKSFQQFKVLLAQELSRAPLEIVYEDVSEKDDIQTITEKIFKATVRAILDTLNTINFSEIEKAARLVERASRIMFFGFAASAAVAHDAFHKFSRIGKDCIFSSDEHIMVTLLAVSKPDDLVVAISHTGESKGIVEVARKAKELKIPVIAITGNDKSSLAKLSTVVLKTNAKETKIRTDAMTSRIVQLVILDTIYTAVAAKNPQFVENLKKTKLAVSELKY